MKVLLYDQDRERNKYLYEHLEDDDITVFSVCCLKEFLAHVENPSLKVIIVERSRIDHYNLNIEKILDRYGFTFTVIVYTQREAFFDFTTHYLPIYFQFPFTTTQDKQLIKKVKISLTKLKKPETPSAEPVVSQIRQVDTTKFTDIMYAMKLFPKKQRILIEKFLEKKEGINLNDIIQILDAGKSKNRQNYAQSFIHRLRRKLQLIFGNKYIIAYRNHSYQLLCSTGD